MYRRFGSKVTIVEQGSRLIRREDVSQAVRDSRKRRDRRAARRDLPERAGNGNGIAVGLDCAGGGRGSRNRTCCSRSDACRTPTISEPTARASRPTRAAIEVDEQLRTNVPGIWALGDCNGRGAFTHTAYNDYEIVAANLLDNDPRKVSDRIAYALYVDPPLGRIGMTLAQAKQTGRRLLVGTRPMTRVGRAVEKARAWVS